MCSWISLIVQGSLLLHFIFLKWLYVLHLQLGYRNLHANYAAKSEGQTSIFLRPFIVEIQNTRTIPARKGEIFRASKLYWVLSLSVSPLWQPRDRNTEGNAIKQRKIAKVCAHKISYGHVFLSPNKSFRYFLILFIGKVFPTSFSLQEMREVIQWHWKEQKVKGKKTLIMRKKRVVWKTQGAKERRKPTR